MVRQMHDGSKDIFEELREAVALAKAENELPDFLAQRSLCIADQSERYRHLEREIAELVAKLSLYDTYGQTGYLGMGVNDLILDEALKRIEKQAAD